MSVHELPTLTEKVLLCGLPPLSVWPLPQLRFHETSPLYEPPEHVIVLVTSEGAGGGGGEGDAGGDSGGGGFAWKLWQRHFLEDEHVPVLPPVPSK